MENKKDTTVDRGIKLIMQELKEDPYRKFNIAFSLMSIIPFLVFVYLLVTKLFTVNILIGNVGLVLFISIFIALCGFFIGYTIVKNILTRIIYYAAQAKHSDQLKSSFVATVSHELKNPLLTIKISLSNMREGLVGQISEGQKKVIELCCSVTERMGRLITDLLDLHKIEAGMFQIKRTLCNLSAILDSQIREYDALLNKKRIKLNKKVAYEVLPLWADENKITEVINNLLSNAIKYTPDGGEVDLKIDYAEGLIRLECIDAGPGIPPDKLDKIFDKFERLDIAKEGTGLGLAITKDIVEMHQGKIWVENMPEGGSKFVVVLPRDLRKSSR